MCIRDRYWNFSTTEETITFGVNVSTNGWVGFGISPSGGMVNSDVIIGWVNDEGQTFFHVSNHDREAVVSLMRLSVWGHKLDHHLKALVQCYVTTSISVTLNFTLAGSFCICPDPSPNWSTARLDTPPWWKQEWLYSPGVLEEVDHVWWEGQRYSSKFLSFKGHSYTCMYKTLFTLRLIPHVWSMLGTTMILLTTIPTMVQCTMEETVVQPVSICCLVSPILQYLTQTLSSHLLLV